MDANLLNLLNSMMPQANLSSSTTQSAQPTTVENPGLFAQQLASILGNLEAQNTSSQELSDNLLANLTNLDQNVLMENLQSMQINQLSNSAFDSDQIAQQLELALAQIMKQLTNGQTSTEELPQSIRGLISSMLEQVKKLDYVNPQATETQMWMSVKAVTISVQKADNQELEMIRTEQSELYKTQSGKTSEQDMWFKVRITVVSVTAWQSYAELNATENPNSTGTAPECVPVSMLKGNPDLAVLPNITDPILYSSFDLASKGNGTTLLDQIKQLAPQMKALNGELEIVVDQTKTTDKTTTADTTRPTSELVDEAVVLPQKAVDQTLPNTITEPVNLTAVQPSELNVANLDNQQESTIATLVTSANPKPEVQIENTPVEKAVENITKLINPSVDATVEGEPVVNVSPKADVIEPVVVNADPKIVEPSISKDTTINSSVNTPKPYIQSQNPNSGQLNNPTQPQNLSFEQLLNQAKPSVQASSNPVQTNNNQTLNQPVQTAQVTDVLKSIINPQPIEINPALPETIQPTTPKPTTNVSPVTKLTDIPHTDIKLNSLMSNIGSPKQQFGHNLTLPPQIDELVKFSGVGFIKPNIQSQTEMQIQDRILAHSKSVEYKPNREESEQPILRELRNDNNLMFAPRLDLELQNTRKTLTEVNQTLRQELQNLHEQTQNDPRTSSPVREITIKLDPPQLGEMTARMQIKGGELIVQLQVSSQQTRDLLDRELQTLRSQLKESGLAGAQIKVEMQSERHGQSQQQANQWQTSHSNSSGNSGNRNQFGENVEPLPESVIQTNSIWALLEPSTTTIGVNLYNDPQAKYF